MMLEVKNIDLFYGDAQALSKVSLSVNSGELVAIVGGNGAGKTSLIRSVTGIERPRGGKIFFNGKEITHLESHDIAELGLAHVAEGRQIFPTMTIQENLQVAGSLKRSRKHIAENLERVYEFFPKLKLRKEQLAGTLSGGEQQMLAIGRALMEEPKMILFDEPSLGLAPIMVKEMFRLIRQLHEKGMTILLVEQNVMASLEIASKAYVLENGEITLSGTSKDLLHHEGVKKAYLGL